jgi:hypothetical protein
MFGSLIVAKNATEVIAGVPEVAALTGDRSIHDAAVPQDLALPALIYYSEQGTYDSPPLRAGAWPSRETVRFVYRLIDDGESFAAIIEAAEALFLAFSGQRFHCAFRGHTYMVTYEAIGEYPMPTFTTQDAQHFRQLGNVFTARVTG